MEDSRLVLFGRRCHLDLDAAVLGTTFCGRVIGGRIALAHTYGFDVARVNAVANQVVLDRLGAALRKICVVRSAAGTIRMACGDDELESRPC